MRWGPDGALARRVSLVACLILAGGAGAQDAARGREIFLGRAEGLEDATARDRLARLPCMSCHGRDGRGGTEGRAPPIDGPSLARGTADRPAYDAPRFARAIAEGRAAGDRPLSRLMPRYALSAREAADLFAYLGVLPREQRRGVAPDRIAIGLPDLSRLTGASGTHYEEVMERALRDRLGGLQVHGRRIELIALSPETPAEGLDLLAVLALPRAAMPRFVEAGMPVLFPLGQLSGEEDPSLVRDFLPSAKGYRRSLAERLAVSARGAVAVRPPGAEAEAMSLALRLAGAPVEGTPGPETREVIVLQAGAVPAALAAAPDARLWIDWQVLAQLGAPPDGREAVAVVDMPLLLEMQADAGTPPLLTHARIAGTILAEALMQAGRDLTRAGLVRAFGSAWLAELELDFTAIPLTGTDRLRFVELPGADPPGRPRSAE